MKVVSGSYKMGIGYGEGDTPPPIAATVILHAGSEYEMTQINGWHYVNPIKEPSLSLMITGKPWIRWAPRSDKVLKCLPDHRMADLLEAFRRHYY
jgi:hypothetical protein